MLQLLEAARMEEPPVALRLLDLVAVPIWRRR
jgi:hypothetical protein